MWSALYSHSFFSDILNKNAVKTSNSISELYDSNANAKPGGTMAQAWSVSEILKIVTRMDAEWS